MTQFINSGRIYHNNVPRTIVTIIPGESNTSNETDIAYLRKVISVENNRIELKSQRLFVLTADVFSRFIGKKIVLDNVIVTTPVTVDRIFTNRDDQDLQLFNTRILTILNFDEIVEIPKCVEGLKIIDQMGIMTIKCHDKLTHVALYGYCTIVHLANCNKLKNLRILGQESYVYGSFMNYLGSIALEGTYNPRENLYNYLGRFGKLVRYKGMLDTEVMSLFSDIKEVYSDDYEITSMDDIPDSLEILDTSVFMITDREEEEGYYLITDRILKAKPNIRKVQLYVETLPGNIERSELLQQLLDSYPNVEFTVPEEITLKSLLLMVGEHNEKAR